MVIVNGKKLPAAGFSIVVFPSILLPYNDENGGDDDDDDDDDGKNIAPAA